ncbi:hypothetical protein KBD33_05555 [Candidatus Gracilibacteria bacterium]|nr:hypothetical protein [Candidatus Gracilibacteria bacterium]
MVHPDPRGLQLFIPVTPGFSQVQEADSNIMKYEQGRVLAMVDAIILKDKRIQVWNVQEIKSKGFLIQMLK